VTDVIGATAVLHGPAGHVLNRCETPCSFNNLSPSRYSLEVQKDGYQSVQTALQVKSGDAQDQKIKLESLAKGIFISSQPPGADVFINGAKQSGQTPVTLPLAPRPVQPRLAAAGFRALCRRHSGQGQYPDAAQRAAQRKIHKPRRLGTGEHHSQRRRNHRGRNLYRTVHTGSRASAFRVAHGDAEVEWISAGKANGPSERRCTVTINESLHEK